MSMAKDKNQKDSSRFQNMTDNFLKWFESSPGTRLSAKTTLADLTSRNAGRGVVANANISADEELFATPRTLVLQKSASEVCSKLSASFADLGPWESLILVIIYEYLRLDSSPWFAYLQLLPTTFDTLMFWTPEELSELQGSAVVDKVGKESAEEGWRTTILPIMLDNEGLFPTIATNSQDRERQLLALAHMAGSMIMAYAFDMEEDDSDDNEEDTADGAISDLTEDDEDNPAKGMVPFADMLNADAHRNNARLYHEGHFLIMKATKDIQAGEEIFNDYGPLPRSDLMRMYGYVTENYAPFDVVEISADLIENVAASSGMRRKYLTRVREELESYGLIDDAFAIRRPASGSKLENTIPVGLRILITAFCQPAEKFHSSKLSQHLQGSGLALTEASLLLTSITNRLRDYKSSIQEDSYILKKPEAQANTELPTGVAHNRYEMAVRVRKGEKEILHHLLELTQDFIKDHTHQVATDSAKRKRDDSYTGATQKKRPKPELI